MPANEHRGEVDLDLAGGKYVMRPTWEAMDRIEQQIGKALARLNLEYRENGITLHECSVIITECVRAHGRETNNIAETGFQLDRVKKLVFDTGVQSVLAPVLQVLLNMLSGGAEAKPGKKKAARKASG